MTSQQPEKYRSRHLLLIQPTSSGWLMSRTEKAWRLCQMRDQTIPLVD